MTEPFDNKKKVVVYDCGEAITFSTDEVLNVGQEVRLKGDNTVGARTATTQIPIGVVTVKSNTEDTNVVVNTGFSQVLNGVAGATLTAGTYVKQNGSFTNGLPQYVAAASGDIALGYTLIGGASGSVIRVGTLKSPKTI